RLRDPRCRGQHGGSSKAVTDEELRRLLRLAKKGGCRDEVFDVGREVAVREFAFAAAEPGEVEAQHGDATRGQRPANARGGEPVLGARETVRKEGVCQRRVRWVVEARGEGAALRP